MSFSPNLKVKSLLGGGALAYTLWKKPPQEKQPIFKVADDFFRKKLTEKKEFCTSSFPPSHEHIRRLKGCLVKIPVPDYQL